MDTRAQPIIATTTLSFLMHGVAFAGLLLVYDQVITQDEGVGRGVEIHLISSIRVSDQVEASEKVEQDVEQLLQRSVQMMASSEAVLTSHDDLEIVTELKDVEQPVNSQLDQQVEQQHVAQQNWQIVKDKESVSLIAQSTNASQQQHSILELLHRRISENKKYPYLAKRQRREGVATVAFILHPDGKIEGARLVNSSRASVLDRAALTAVKHIEPFTIANEYLEHAEAFQVDIEFELL